MWKHPNWDFVLAISWKEYTHFVYICIYIHFGMLGAPALSLNSLHFLFNCVFCLCQVIRGAGHYVFADQPDDFNQAVLQILTRTEKEKWRSKSSLVEMTQCLTKPNTLRSSSYRYFTPLYLPFTLKRPITNWGHLGSRLWGQKVIWSHGFLYPSSCKGVVVNKCDMQSVLLT